MKALTLIQPNKAPLNIGDDELAESPASLETPFRPVVPLFGWTSLSVTQYKRYGVLRTYGST